MNGIISKFSAIIFHTMNERASYFNLTCRTAGTELNKYCMSQIYNSYEVCMTKVKVSYVQTNDGQGLDFNRTSLVSLVCPNSQTATESCETCPKRNSFTCLALLPLWESSSHKRPTKPVAVVPAQFHAYIHEMPELPNPGWEKEGGGHTQLTHPNQLLA